MKTYSLGEGEEQALNEFEDFCKFSKGSSKKDYLKWALSEPTEMDAQTIAWLLKGKISFTEQGITSILETMVSAPEAEKGESVNLKDLIRVEKEASKLVLALRSNPELWEALKLLALERAVKEHQVTFGTVAKEYQEYLED